MVRTKGDGSTTSISAVQTIDITQFDPPSAPAAVNCTTAANNDGKLTGVTTAMEYQKPGEPSWTSGTGSDITGLTSGTYLVRFKTAGTAFASEPQILTVSECAAALTGTVLIRGMAMYQETLTADYNGNHVGDLTYHWKRGTTPVDENRNTYTLTQADIGSTLTCEVTCTGLSGAVTSAPTAVVSKASIGTAPLNLTVSKPTTVGGTDGKINGTTTEMEYATNTSFTGAVRCTAPSTTVAPGDYFVRIAETDTRLYSIYTPVTVPANTSGGTSGGNGGGSSGSGGSGASGGGAAAPASGENRANVGTTVSNGTAAVSVTDAQIKEIAAAKSDAPVKVDLSALKAEKAVLPAKLLSAAKDAPAGKGLEIALPAGSVTLDAKTLEVLGGKDVALSVAPVKPEKLTENQRNIMGERLETAVIIDINLLANNVQTSTFGGGAISVSVPYTPKAGEDTGKLVVWYLADDGSIEARGGSYNEKTRAFEFTTNHLSTYALVTFPFADVAAGSYYYSAVVWAQANHITGGRTASTFAPAATCTRAQMATFLWRAAGSPEPVSTENPFTDVSADAYYYKAVLWAVEKGITRGAGDGAAFSPAATCTRGQMAAFLYRYAGSPAVTGSCSFTDVPASAYYNDAVTWAAGKGVTNGANSTGATFNPAGNCTRGQIVTFLYRLIAA